MKATVKVALKRSVLDPQGQTIQGALAQLGFGAIAAVRQGKVFELELGPGVDRTEAERQVERAAREVLSNPVIEEFSFRIED